MKSHEEQKRLAVKYFEGTASSRERQELSEALGTGVDGRDILSKAEREWESERDIGADEKRSLAKIICALDTEEKEKKRSVRVLNRLRVLSAAACVALAVMAGSMIVGYIHGHDPEFITVSTRAGQGSEIVMPDGTNVFLRGNSRLTYPSTYSASNRSATLVGKAYFDVTPDKDHPFILDLGKCSIKVLGTSFDVSAPSNGERIRTTLLRGSIELNTPGGITKMSPGESVSFRAADNSLTLNNVDTESYLSLMDGLVEYYDVTISQLAKYLERLYGIPIYIDDELASNKTGYSLRLSNRESFEEVISALRVMLPMGIRYEGEKVWLNAK